MSKPNFLIIMTDEHDPRVSTPYGHPFIRTPNIQRLADRGVVFENAYCNSPLCVPSRASFMTGKYLHRIGVWDNSTSLSSNEPTWAHRLNLAGYDTALSARCTSSARTSSTASSASSATSTARCIALVDWDTKEGWATPSHKQRLAEAGPGDYLYQQYDDCVADRAIQVPGRGRAARPSMGALRRPDHPPLPAHRPRAVLEPVLPRHADLPNHPRPPRRPAPAEQAPARVLRTRRRHRGADPPRPRRLLRPGHLRRRADRHAARRARAQRPGREHRRRLRLRPRRDGRRARPVVEVLLLRGLLPHPLHRGLAAALHPGRRTRLTSLVDLTRTVLDLAGCRHTPPIWTAPSSPTSSTAARPTAAASPSPSTTPTAPIARPACSARATSS